MTRRAMAVWLCCLAVVLFLSRYGIALGIKGRTVASFDVFWNQVGFEPWVVAGGFLVVGVVYMILAECDK